MSDRTRSGTHQELSQDVRGGASLGEAVAPRTESGQSISDRRRLERVETLHRSCPAGPKDVVFERAPVGPQDEDGKAPNVKEGHGTFGLRLGRALKIAAAAAAVISLAALFQGTHSPSGTTPTQVANGVGQARNVHLLQIDLRNDRVTYEMWISRSMNLVATTTAETCVVHDLAAREVRDMISGTVTQLDDVRLDHLRETQDRYLGFAQRGIPGDAKCEIRSGEGNLEIREYSWMGRASNGRDIPTRCEVTIDTSTMSPVSVRLSHQGATESGGEGGFLTQLEYLTDAQMQAVVAGGSLAGVGDVR